MSFFKKKLTLPPSRKNKAHDEVEALYKPNQKKNNKSQRTEKRTRATSGHTAPASPRNSVDARLKKMAKIEKDQTNAQQNSRLAWRVQRRKGEQRYIIKVKTKKQKMGRITARPPPNTQKH